MYLLCTNTLVEKRRLPNSSPDSYQVKFKYTKKVLAVCRIFLVLIDPTHLTITLFGFIDNLELKRLLVDNNSISADMLRRF